MATCGNRAKVRAWRDRQRVDGLGARRERACANGSPPARDDLARPAPRGAGGEPVDLAPHAELPRVRRPATAAPGPDYRRDRDHARDAARAGRGASGSSRPPGPRARHRPRRADPPRRTSTSSPRPCGTCCGWTPTCPASTRRRRTTRTWPGRRAGAGRMIRSPTVFEDVVKTVCTTNCAWSATVRMVHAIVGHLGDPAAGVRRRRPLGRRVPHAGGDGRRRRGLLSGRRPGRATAGLPRPLARSVADGELDLEALGTRDPRGAARRRARGSGCSRSPASGPYAAAHIMMTLGRYSPPDPRLVDAAEVREAGRPDGRRRRRDPAPLPPIRALRRPRVLALPDPRLGRVIRRSAEERGCPAAAPGPYCRGLRGPESYIVRREARPYVTSTHERAVMAIPRRARACRASLRAERRTLRQGLVALVLSTAAGFVAGLTLGSHHRHARGAPRPPRPDPRLRRYARHDLRRDRRPAGDRERRRPVRADARAGRRPRTQRRGRGRHDVLVVL